MHAACISSSRCEKEGSCLFVTCYFLSFFFCAPRMYFKSITHLIKGKQVRDQPERNRVRDAFGSSENKIGGTTRLYKVVVKFSNHWNLGSQKERKNQQKATGSKIYVYTRNKTIYLATNHWRKKKQKKRVNNHHLLTTMSSSFPSVLHACFLPFHGELRR